MGDGKYKVGFGKPPKHTQFETGRSGNPKGRPKGARGLKTDLRAELSETIKVTEHGRTRHLTKQRAVVKALAAKAMRGDPRAIAKLIDLALELFGVDGDQAATVKLSESDEALLAEFLAQNGATGDGSDN